MLKNLTKSIAPALTGANFIGNIEASSAKDYYKGSIHAVIPYFILAVLPFGKLSAIAAIIYFICVTFLYCTTFKHKNEGYFYTHGFILFAIMFYIILKVF